MKVVFLAPGRIPIPPHEQGTSEIIVWDYYRHLKALGHEVAIVNQRSGVAAAVNALKPDIVQLEGPNHIDSIAHIQCPRILFTTHDGRWGNVLILREENSQRQIYQALVKHKERVEICAINEATKQLYTAMGFPKEKIHRRPNGVDQDMFRCAKTPLFPNRSIYLARIVEIKRQYLVSAMKDVYFTDNLRGATLREILWDIARSVRTRKKKSLPLRRYLYAKLFPPKQLMGWWTNDRVHHSLTDYGNLVLLSSSEGDPMCVKEGLMAGLGVVVSEAAANNLDATKDFITIIPEKKIHDRSYLTTQIRQNRATALKKRAEIRAYAIKNFSIKDIVKRYSDQILSKQRPSLTGRALL